MGSRSARAVAVAGPPAASAARMPRRLGSARAVKTCSAIDSMSGGIEVFDQLVQLVAPALGVALERLAVRVLRQLAESALHHREPGTVADLFQRELHVRAARVAVGQAVDPPREAEDAGLF